MDVLDLIAAAGLVMLFAGLWLVAPALALTVVGAAMFLASSAVARLAERRNADDG